MAYVFESVGSRQTADSPECRVLAREFYRRVVDAQAPALDPTKVALSITDRRLLDGYTTWVLANIVWYQKRSLREHRSGEALDALIVLIVVVVIGVSAAAALRSHDGGSSLVGQLGMAVTIVMAMLKLVSEGHDFQKYRGNFRQAEAELKELAYTLEDEFRDRPTTAAEGDIVTFTAELRARLAEQIRDARAIVKAEQQRYFELYVSPTTLIASATTAWQTAGGVARKPARSLVDDKLRDARARLRDVTAELDRLSAVPEAQRTPDQTQRLRELTADKSAAELRARTLEEVQGDA